VRLRESFPLLSASSEHHSLVCCFVWEGKSKKHLGRDTTSSAYSLCFQKLWRCFVPSQRSDNWKFICFTSIIIATQYCVFARCWLCLSLCVHKLLSCPIQCVQSVTKIITSHRVMSTVTSYCPQSTLAFIKKLIRLRFLLAHSVAFVYEMRRVDCRGSERNRKMSWVVFGELTRAAFLFIFAPRAARETSHSTTLILRKKSELNFLTCSADLREM
jgi:hypothetical protein